MSTRLYNTYKKDIVKQLVKSQSYSNIMKVPKVEKVVINVGAGKAIGNSAFLESVVKDLTAITGQKPVITKAKRSESNFKLRQGAPIGVKVTLRKHRMYEFLDRLISLALPRVRDFEGLSFKSFDGRGNYTFGIKEHLIFHEVDFDKINDIIGMDVTIVTSAPTNEEAEALLRAMGLPIKHRKDVNNG